MNVAPLSLQGPVLLAVVLILGIGLGVSLDTLQWRQIERSARRLPERWLLAPRLLANNRERKVWRWFLRAFYDHHVMVKVAVTRFTIPRRREDAQRLHELLNTVYCIFTVCSPGGQVLGCVDVPGSQGLSKANRHLKRSLLTRCGLACWMIEPEQMPTVTDIRTAFLGQAAVAAAEVQAQEAAAMVEARRSLRAAVERQRLSRLSEYSPSAPGVGPMTAPPETPHNGRISFAPQENSFLTPLDSRKVPLNRGCP